MKKYEQDIDFFEMFVSFLSKWRSVIIVSLAFGLIFGATVFAESMIELQNEDETNQKLIEYNNNLVYNNQAKMISREKTKQISCQIDELKNYIDNSIYMSIDSSNVYTSVTKFYVKTDYKIIPAMSYQDIDYSQDIINTYITILTDERFLQEVGSKFNIDLKDLKSLVSVNNEYSTSDDSSSILSVCIIGNNDQTVSGLMDCFLDEIDRNKSIIDSKIDEHSLYQITSSSYSKVDEEILENQIKEREKLSELMETYYTEQDNYEKLKKEVIKEPDVLSSSMLKSIIKAILFGSFVGLLCMFFIISFKYVCSDIVYSKKMLGNRYDIQIIANMPRNRKLNFIDKLIRKIERKEIYTEDMSSKKIKYVATYIKNNLDNDKTLLITGDDFSEDVLKVLNDVKTLLPGYNISICDNIINSSSALNEFSQCDTVVVVSQCEKSRFSTVDSELDYILRNNKILLGFIIFDN